MKCIGLFSGGLDSLIAIKLIESFGIEVIPLSFKSYFFSEKKILKIGEKNNIKPIVVDISDEHLKIVKNPVYGYGRFLNPCIDCHALMIKTAYNLMKEYDASFIITGEVLNERPFSQTREGLAKVDKLTGLGDITLRPLSAKLLNETKIEREGWVKREELLGIEGRSRKKQFELIKKFNIKDFEQPAGGCILTNEEFCKRLKPFIMEIKGEDIDIFSIGRHFIFGNSHIIIGRNEKENNILESKGFISFFLDGKTGPTGVFRILEKEEHREFAAELILRYSKEKKGIVIFSDGIKIEATVKDLDFYEKYLIK